MHLFLNSGVLFECNRVIFNEEHIKNDNLENSHSRYKVLIYNENFNDPIFNIKLINANNFCKTFIDSIKNVYYLIYGKRDIIIIIDFNNRLISIYINNKDEAELLPFLFQADVVSCILNYENIPIIHASSVVECNERLWAFMAPSKTGKSTMGTYFVSKGCKYFTDDILPIYIENGKVKTYQSLLPLKLREESNNYFRSTCCHMNFKFAKNVEHDITSIFFLRPKEDVNSVQIQLEDEKSALRLLLQNLHLHTVKLNGANSKKIAKIVLCSKQVPIYSLYYKKNYENLESIYQKVMESRIL
jgi:hypothetical protein